MQTYGINFGNFELIDYKDKYYNEVLSFIDAGYKDLGYSAVDLETIDEDLKNISGNYALPNCFKLLVDEAGRILGSTAVTFKDGDASLKRIFVDNSLRGQGIGRNLSIWAFNYAKEQGAQIMHIWSGSHCKVAHDLYTKLGAENTGKSRFIGGPDEIIELYFKKQL